MSTGLGNLTPAFIAGFWTLLTRVSVGLLRCEKVGFRFNLRRLAVTCECSWSALAAVSGRPLAVRHRGPIDEASSTTGCVADVRPAARVAARRASSNTRSRRPARARRRGRGAAGDGRFVAATVDASSAAAVADLCREHGITHVLNAVDPRFVMPIFDGAFAAGARLPRHGDVAVPTRTRREPYEQSGVKLGDEQFAAAEQWERAPAGWRWSASASSRAVRRVRPVRRRPPVLRDRRDRRPRRREPGRRRATTSPRRSRIWTTIEECLNPPVIWEDDRGWFTTAPFSEPEVFDFPEGIGPVECVNVEHEEVLLIPRWVDARRVTFKYGLGDEFIDVLKTLHKLGLDRTEKVRRSAGSRCPRATWWPRACPTRPGSATGCRQDLRRHLGARAPARTAEPREVYLYHVVDNEWSMREYGSQAVVWQTAINPVVALELLAAVPGPAWACWVRRRSRRSLPGPADRVRITVGPAGTVSAIAGPVRRRRRPRRGGPVRGSGRSRR